MGARLTADAISRWNELLVEEPDRDASIECWRGEFAGRHLVPGWREDDASWAREIATALEADFVAQHRVELQREDYPSMEAGAPARRFYEDTDPFMFRGEFGGMLTRLGTAEITSVHADGSVCATVAVAPAS